VYGMELVGCLSFDHGIVGPGALAALCHVWEADGLQCQGFRFGLWPWELASGERQVEHHAQQMRAAVRQAAMFSGETWLFTQVALCTWKMHGCPVLGVAEEQEIRADGDASVRDQCVGQLSRNTLRAALRIADIVSLGDEYYPHTRRWDFAADAVAAAAAAAGRRSVRDALLAACACHFAPGHVVARRAASWSLPGYSATRRSVNQASG
jgi:hypothetical protein